jgi:hypothetical protein
VISLNEAKRTLDIYTSNPAKAVKTAYRVRVKAKWPPFTKTTETSNIFKIKVTVPAQPSPTEINFAPLKNPTSELVNNAEASNKTIETCPFGSNPEDCLPKIKKITNSGVMTLFFPMPLELILNEIDFRNASRTLDIQLKQREPQMNVSIIDW